jgi:hypothetical protein
VKAFLTKIQNDESLRQVVVASGTADDVTQTATSLDHNFLSDKLLRLSGQKAGQGTLTKQDVPDEYN